MDNSSFFKNWKYRSFVIATFLLLVVFCLYSYNYYKSNYLPQKKLNYAVAEIIANLNSENDSIKSEYSHFVLIKNYDWGYADVNSFQIISFLENKRADAFRQIEKMAQSGNIMSQMYLGQIYLWGENQYYLPDSIAKKELDSKMQTAIYWFEKAEQQGCVQAYYYLATAYEAQNTGNTRKSVDFYKKGAEEGDNLAQYKYGKLFSEGVVALVVDSNHIHKHPTRSYSYYDYYYETLVEKDMKKAVYWWKKSAAQGNTLAIKSLQKVGLETVRELKVVNNDITQ